MKAKFFGLVFTALFAGPTLMAVAQTSTAPGQAAESTAQEKRFGIFFNGIPLPFLGGYGLTGEYKLKSNLALILGAEVRKSSQVGDLTENDVNRDVFFGLKYFIVQYPLPFSANGSCLLPFIGGGYQFGQAQATVNETISLGPPPPSAQKTLTYGGTYANLGVRFQGPAPRPGFTIDVAAAYVPGQIYDTNFTTDGNSGSNIDMSVRYEVHSSIQIGYQF